MGPTNPPKASRQHRYRVYHSETAGPGTPRHGPTEPSKGLAAAPLYIVPLRSCRTHPALGPPNPPKASRQHLLLYRSETARHTLPWAHRTLQRPRHSTSTVPLRNCRTRPTQPSKGLAAAPLLRRSETAGHTPPLAHRNLLRPHGSTSIVPLRNCRTHPMGPTNPPKASRQHLYCTTPKLPGTPRHGPTEPSKGLAAAPLYIAPLRSCRTHPALGPPNPPKASRQHLLLYRSETAGHTLPWAYRTLQRPVATAPLSYRSETAGHTALGPPKPPKALRQHLSEAAGHTPAWAHRTLQRLRSSTSTWWLLLD